MRRRDPHTAAADDKVPAGSAWYDAMRIAFPFGLKERLGRFHAPSRAAAELIALELYGADVVVTLATNVRRRPRPEDDDNPYRRANARKRS